MIDIAKPDRLFTVALVVGLLFPAYARIKKSPLKSILVPSPPSESVYTNVLVSDVGFIVQQQQSLCSTLPQADIRVSSFSEIPKVNKNEFNIMLIKETTWDSNMYVGEKVTYTILIYDKDDVMEKLKASKNLEMLNRLKEEFKLEFSKEGESIGK